MLAALLAGCQREGVQSDRGVETPTAGVATPPPGGGITGPTTGAAGTGTEAGAAGGGPRAGAGAAASAPDTAVSSAAAVPPESLAPSLTQAERDFMVEAAANSLYEIDVASLATRKAADEKIKDLALTLVSQQQGANEELKLLAKERRVALPEQMSADKKALVDRLAQAEGPSFDRQFLALGIEDRQAAIRRFEEASRVVQDPKLRAWIDRTLPILRDHLARAQKIPAPQVG